VRDDSAAPEGMSWVPGASLGSMPVDPVSALITGSLAGKP
jgi:hypothetical protein